MWNTIKQGLLVGVVLLANAAFAATSADASKVLRTVFEAPDSGFDPALTTNYYSGKIIEAVYESLLTYDYLARPAKLVPKTIEAMPEVADGGKTYTFHLKKGIRFTPDPAFKGVPRELTAKDYEYSYKRILDPQNRSPVFNFLAGKIAGLDELAEKAKKTGRFDYDAAVPGLQVIDRYTLRIRLNKPDYNFLYVAAYTGLGAVAREVIEAYGNQSGQHPVGTGAYMLQQYIPHSKIVLAANPDYRGFTWDFQSAEQSDDALVREMHGKEMPQIGRVDISIIEEEQARWLAFQDRQLDLDFLPQVAAPKVMDGDKLKPEFARRGIKLSRAVDAGLTYWLFNFRDPVVGGYTKEKIALRRAIAMAYDTSQEIKLIRNGQALKAEAIIPPGVVGYDPTYRSIIPFDPAMANKLLDKFGYKRGADGYRTMPDGKPLTIVLQRETGVTYQEMAELWKRGLEQIGIRSEHPVGTFSDDFKAATECKLMMWGGAWFADYPDGENFLQQLYGPNSGQGNLSCYQSPAFDAMYEKAVAMPHGPERDRLYSAMNRQVEVDTAWLTSAWRVRNWIVQPWIIGFKKHTIMHAEWQYMDIEKH
jgi:ABC-type transport system substrate-binding protein